MYDALCKQIRALDLPLNVNTLQGISPVFRGAEVWKKIVQSTMQVSDLLLSCSTMIKRFEITSF